MLGVLATEAGVDRKLREWKQTGSKGENAWVQTGGWEDAKK